MSVTIYHNPDCGTSRNALALLRDAGESPRVIEYLKTPPDRETLERLIAASGLTFREAIRVKGTPYHELRLDNPELNDDQLIEAMLLHPILINRPFVTTARGTALCRPSDIVLDLLDKVPDREILKEEAVPFIVCEPVSGSQQALADALREASLPTDDLGDHGCAFYAFRSLSGLHLGFGGLEMYGKDVLIRSLVVPEAHRGDGIGRNVLAVLLREAFDAGARTAWLFTTTAAAFFEQAGFKLASREAAPPAILATRQASSLCPSSAALLSRAISL
ncbi:arsenate reductase (glutaredoxin) [Caballeronia sp. EK]|uniref:arsenic resistance N-acetyltransferase ArsN2 n=1 Tax=Caballeronia sp. EK TaxID=2767469 RepID=UPI0016561E2C|nr:arsenic resistance N-acetyltransferase ArsN2 [Caballeronia sp. EK]MBC8638304.1 arsenate reductase (glutaredoxin) [Caballeronia sp. EK]